MMEEIPQDGHAKASPTSPEPTEPQKQRKSHSKKVLGSIEIAAQVHVRSQRGLQAQLHFWSPTVVRASESPNHWRDPFLHGKNSRVPAHGLAASSRGNGQPGTRLQVNKKAQVEHCNLMELLVPLPSRRSIRHREPRCPVKKMVQGAGCLGMVNE